jgi:hypothetical protein
MMANTSADAPASSATAALDAAQVAQAYAAAQPPAPVKDTGPVFHGLFRTGATEEAVAPLVSALWTAPTPITDDKPAAAAPQAKPKPVAKPTPLPEPLGATGTGSLFEDQVPDARALFRGRV